MCRVGLLRCDSHVACRSSSSTRSSTATMVDIDGGTSGGGRMHRDSVGWDSTRARATQRVGHGQRCAGSSVGRNSSDSEPSRWSTCFHGAQPSPATCERPTSRDATSSVRETDDEIRRIASESAVTLLAWGSHGTLLEQGRDVARLVPEAMCLGRTRSGELRHPLYVAADVAMEPFSAIASPSERESIAGAVS